MPAAASIKGEKERTANLSYALEKVFTVPLSALNQKEGASTFMLALRCLYQCGGGRRKGKVSFTTACEVRRQSGKRMIRRRKLILGDPLPRKRGERGTEKEIRRALISLSCGLKGKIRIWRDKISLAGLTSGEDGRGRGKGKVFLCIILLYS